MATFQNSSTEWLVPCDSEIGNESCPRRPNLRRTACKQLSLVLIVCWWFLGTIGVSYTYAQYRITRAKHLCGQLLYSPAQDVIEYQLQTFTQGFGDGVTEYWGAPSEEMDQRWAELWHFSVGEAITRDEAQRLSNTTSTLGPRHPGLYWIKLDVFHQLHCLNALRMSVWPEYYSDPYYAAILEKDHLAHCIDSIRQSIMCHSDITPLVLQWDDNLQKSRHRANLPHSCRNFDKIREWAVKRAIAQMTYDGDWTDPELQVDGMKIQEP
ncbi:Cyclochlorotine biosynthesis protein O [Colletotrichum gloeosporioides]|uniref:Cyclochlorotine biosynthesis protein O n=1 Tax=Colletotrichum gloeosporioides TaxID=474922 RepID=A0A8H4FJ15_COLGL|nr:Cyclochlorotine biosynthesis protein O [Colletotrichum gloeosporioides]KAF3802774.1 Cyclochlorotine biosynthesis protein O [Colletotrichum gloeosporioides]